MTVGARIKALRVARRLSQDELGAMLGRSQRVISTWERGRQVPADMVPRIARAFSVPIDSLFVAERDPNAVKPRAPDEVQCDNCFDQVEYRPYQIYVQRFDRDGNKTHTDLLRLCGECGSGLRIVLRLNKAVG